MQHLLLTRPLVFLDLETTGVNPAVDRIVELSLVKVHPLGLRETMTRRVNPGMPIPPQSSAVHGITDADVAGAPTFAQVASELLAFVGEADLAGFNVQRFDLPMLQRELVQAGLRLDLNGRAIVDAQVIYHRRVPRDLSAAYRLYCGKDLHDPHTAQADVEACVEILDAQLAAYPDLPRTPQELADLFTPPRDPNAVDPGRKFIWKNGEAAFNIGKYKDRPLREVAAQDPEYLRWILGTDFDSSVKDIVQNALEGRFPSGGPPAPGSTAA
jgi:DNA polymerase-3 subunit epsilon